MSGLLIATHDQAVHAIRQHLNRPGTDQLLRGVVLRVLDIHYADPPDTAGPWSDCADCEGSGWLTHVDENGVNRRHCDCQCPWCGGCDEPLCAGPCPTVAAIAERLDLTEGAP